MKRTARLSQSPAYPSVERLARRVAMGAAVALALVPATGCILIHGHQVDGDIAYPVYDTYDIGLPLDGSTRVYYPMDGAYVEYRLLATVEDADFAAWLEDEERTLEQVEAVLDTFSSSVLTQDDLSEVHAAVARALTESYYGEADPDRFLDLTLQVVEYTEPIDGDLAAPE